MNKSELKERTMLFALRVFRLIDALPKSVQGRAIAGQLTRSATSVAANYRSACRGRSLKDFVAKLGIAIEEADESMFWMELIIRADLIRRNRIQPLYEEANELTAILSASRKTASRNAKSRLKRDSK